LPPSSTSYSGFHRNGEYLQKIKQLANRESLGMEVGTVRKDPHRELTFDTDY